MVNYACGFNQSETGKYFEWIIIGDTGSKWTESTLFHVAENLPHRPINVHDWMVHVSAGKVRNKIKNHQLIFRLGLHYRLDKHLGRQIKPHPRFCMMELDRKPNLLNCSCCQKVCRNHRLQFHFSYRGTCWARLQCNVLLWQTRWTI